MSCKNCNCKDCVSSRDILKQRMQDSISYSNNNYIKEPLPMPIFDWAPYIQRRRFTKDEIAKAVKKGIDSIGSKPFAGSEPHIPVRSNIDSNQSKPVDDYKCGCGKMLCSSVDKSCYWCGTKL